MVYYNQVIHLPIVVSAGFNSVAAFWTTLAPSTALVLAYHFVLRPRQVRRRIEYVGLFGSTSPIPSLTRSCMNPLLTFDRFFRQARRDLREAKADKVRPVEEIVSLLRDAAKRQMRAEASTDGIVS